MENTIKQLINNILILYLIILLKNHDDGEDDAGDGDDDKKHGRMICLNSSPQSRVFANARVPHLCQGRKSSLYPT